MTRYLTALIIVTGLAAGCAPEEPPPRSTTEFLDNPILLEAAMVRCSVDREATRYDQECMNARQAVQRIQAKEEEDRRVELEARSERKRRALRRTQQAAAEARRRAEESERLRREAEYLAQFGVLPPREEGSEGAEEIMSDGNLPIAVVPEADIEETTSAAYPDVVLPTDGGNAPVAEPAPEEEAPGDLESIREELRRRNEKDDS